MASLNGSSPSKGGDVVFQATFTAPNSSINLTNATITFISKTTEGDFLTLSTPTGLVKTVNTATTQTVRGTIPGSASESFGPGYVTIYYGFILETDDNIFKEQSYKGSFNYVDFI